MNSTVSAQAVKPKRRGRPKKVKTDAEYNAEIQAEIEKLEAVELENLQIIDRHVSTHKWAYLMPYTWQKRLPIRIKEKLIALAPAPNGIGKTVMAVCVLASWVMGYEAWNEVDADYPGAVKADKKYYKPSSLEIAPPVDIRVTGEDWNHHLNRVVVKAMKEWFPCDAFDTKKNTQGVEYFWVHKKNGSTIELMTHGMDVKQYEGWRGHGWIADEPPPYAIFNSMSRGLAEKRGKILLLTTPLREAWILDELILTNRSDTSVVKDLTLYDNEDSYGSDNQILEDFGLSGKNTRFYREADGQKKEFFDLILYVDDKGEAAEKYLIEKAPRFNDNRLNDLIFLKKAKDTDLEEKPSRFFGTFKKLIGLVIKNFDKQKHIIPAFDIPTDWPVTVLIDIHLNKPHAISFYACDKHNRHYAIDEYWTNCTPEEIADLIIRKKKGDLCWNISNVYIDPLSKGDDKFMANRMDVEDSFTIISNRLADEGMYLQCASKDKDSGFRNLRAWLEGPNKIPILYFLDSLQSVQSSARGIVYDIQRLCFDDKGKIEKVNDDFTENMYRYTLTNTEYIDNSDNVLVGAGHSGDTQGWLGE